MLADDIADQIALAGHPAELDDIVRSMWLDHTNGRLDEDAMESLDEAARARREVLQPPRPPNRPLPGLKPIGATAIPRKSKLAPRPAFACGPSRMLKLRACAKVTLFVRSVSGRGRRTTRTSCGSHRPSGSPGSSMVP
jgi:hypothetical protein